MMRHWYCVCGVCNDLKQLGLCIQKDNKGESYGIWNENKFKPRSGCLPHIVEKGGIIKARLSAMPLCSSAQQLAKWHKMVIKRVGKRVVNTQRDDNTGLRARERRHTYIDRGVSEVFSQVHPTKAWLTRRCLRGGESVLYIHSIPFQMMRLTSWRENIKSSDTGRTWWWWQEQAFFCWVKTFFLSNLWRRPRVKPEAALLFHSLIHLCACASCFIIQASCCGLIFDECDSSSSLSSFVESLSLFLLLSSLRWRSLLRRSVRSCSCIIGGSDSFLLVKVASEVIVKSCSR